MSVEASSGSSAEGPLCILCGGGAFPAVVADAVRRRGRDVVLYGIRGFAAPELIERYPHEWIYLGQVGRFMRLNRRHNVREFVLVGSVHRPRLREIRLDWTTIRLFPRYLRMRRGGDNRLLTGIKQLAESLGARVLGAHEVAPEILVPAGVLGGRAPTPTEEADIALGLQVIRVLGPLDVGQAAVVMLGRVAAIEAAEGTAGMLARIVELRRVGRIELGRIGVLVKAPKPGQERRIDLPAIGPETVAQAVAAGLTGIAVEAGGTIVADLDGLISAADAAGLFLVGFESDKD